MIKLTILIGQFLLIAWSYLNPHNPDNGLINHNLVAFNNAIPDPTKSNDLISTEISKANIDEIETVIIDKQVWKKRNLNVSTYRNGDAIRHAASTEEWLDAGIKKEGAWCYNDNDTNNGAIYGKLYNWYAVNDARGLAPKGYHVPSDTEWTNLATYLGSQNVAGGKMKEAGNSHWSNPNTGATNETNFSALPGGYRSNNGKFFGIRKVGYWWSSNRNDDTTSWYIWLRHDFPYLYRYYYDGNQGFSVRCLKD